VVATHTINKNDRSALSAIAIEAKENLGIETYTALGQRISKTNRNLQTSQHHYHCSTTRTRKSNENGTTKDYW
jgi:hypothetical protein